jgi:drug/metabolite transporter (DMT)-like permease
MNPLNLFGLTALTMVAFAANSVLGRQGLLGGDIGAGSFALIRLLSGALVLAVIVSPKRALKSGSWRGGLALFVYAAFFSYAYLQLAAGTGALLLFAIVQITMVGAGLLAGERLTLVQWSGVFAALGALGWLLSPGLEAPPMTGALTMMIAGLGWGVYSLLGRDTPKDPTQNTAGNFIRASLIGALCLLPLILWAMPEQRAGLHGTAWAMLSGGLTSGLGYALWYVALKHLSAARAGVAQLTVPAIAALGGVLFLDEPVTWRFSISCLIILGGVALATLTPAPLLPKPSHG